jgi:hypothetical protein
MDITNIRHVSKVLTCVRFIHINLGLKIVVDLEET